MKYAIGIDIGGTNTRVALVDENLKMIDRIQFATPADDPATAIARITESIQGFSVAPDALAGIGMSCPGPLDLKAGTVIVTPNLGKAWFGYPLTRVLAQATGLPVTLENDANLAALAEAAVGGGKDLRYVQFLTISTGIGAGFVVDKKVYQGAHGFACEVANVCLWQDGPVQGALVPGGIEAIASGTAITRRATAAGLQVRHAGDVNTLALEGNPAAQAIMADAKQYLANFIAALIAINDPEIIILGGSVALKIPGFVETVEALVKEKVFDVIRPTVRVVRSTLDEDSGLLGAAFLAFTSSGD